MLHKQTQFLPNTATQPGRLRQTNPISANAGLDGGCPLWGSAPRPSPLGPPPLPCRLYKQIQSPADRIFPPFHYSVISPSDPMAMGRNVRNELNLPGQSCAAKPRPGEPKRRQVLLRNGMTRNQALPMILMPSRAHYEPLPVPVLIPRAAIWFCRRARVLSSRANFATKATCFCSRRSSSVVI